MSNVKYIHVRERIPILQELLRREDLPQEVQRALSNY